MNEIIKIETTNEGSVVSARELHQFLESKQKFADWIKNRIEKYDFEENKDYHKLYFDVEGNSLIISDPKIRKTDNQEVMVVNQTGYDKYIKPDNQEVTNVHRIDYVITLDMAKELSMIENNEKGRQARKYFIECERKLKEVAPRIPQTFAEALRAYADEVEKNEALKLENSQQKQIIGELQPKASYYDLILSSHDCMTVTQIAKDYGLTAQYLNSKLKDLGVQFKQSEQWLLKEKHSKFGYTKSETVPYQKQDGTMGTALHTKWTQKGRLFLYELLKKNGILPLIEQEED